MPQSPSPSSLAPCPFCGGAMQFRKALWPSDGNTDAVIHAEPTDCGMSGFDTGTADESVLAAWNRRAALSAVEALGQQAEPVADTDAMEAHRINGLAWAVSCWRAEVAQRPLVNVHRRTLDDTWRQVIRYFGGDPDKLLGPNHDTLHMRAQEERAWKP